MIRAILALLLSVGAAWACPSLEIEHRLLPSTLDIRLSGMDDDTQVLVEMFAGDTIIRSAVISNESISFSRPAPGDYRVLASILYPACEGRVFEELVIGEQSTVHYRSSTFRLWHLSIALLLFSSTLLCIALILRR